MIIFLDTNIYAHCLPLKDINPNDLGGNVTVVVTEAICDELDNLKDSHKNGKVRARIRSALSDIEKSASKEDHKLPNGIKIKYFDFNSRVDLKKWNLDEQKGDHRILASILAYQALEEGTDVIFYSNDTTPRIKGRSLGIKCEAFPVKYSLKGELDEIERENIKLKEEVRRHETRVPKFKIWFHDVVRDDDVLTVRKRKISERYTQKQINELEMAQRAKYPLVSLPHPAPTPSRIDQLGLGSSSSSFAFYQEDKRYNDYALNYFNKYRSFLEETNKWRLASNLTICVDLKLENIGTHVANDIDVELRIPFRSVRSEALDPPERPIAPDTEQSAISPRNTPILHLPKEEPGISVFQLFDDENVSYVTKKLQRIKHGHSACIEPFFICIPTYEDMKSFKIGYLITSVDLLDAVRGELEVNVEVVTDE